MKWFEVNPLRFELEKRLLGLHHPGCKLIKQNGQFSVLVQVQTNKRSYVVRGIFPDRFPIEPMQVQIEKPEITDNPPHYFHCNGRLCLYGSSNCGIETTAKVYIDWSKQWIQCYEDWQKTGHWPITNRRRKN